MTLLLLAAGFGGVLVGAVLFTNAVEWAGYRLRLGVGAIGTLLAGVSTALPESAIPVVAVLRADEDADQVAVGAIVGAPFMLATVAMALVGLTAIAYGARREQGRTLRAHFPTLERDLRFFVVMLSVAMVLGLGVRVEIRVVAALLFVLGYAAYVAQTVRHGGRPPTRTALAPLYADPTKHDPPAPVSIGAQLAVGLALIVGSAHLVVEQLIAISKLLDVPPLVLALLVAPLATELPEKANSFLWVRDGKDALALGNVTGAMVFQTTVPVAIGLAFTSWELDRLALLAGALAVAGGLLAHWSLNRRRRFEAHAIVAWSALFVTFAAVVVLLQ